MKKIIILLSAVVSIWLTIFFSILPLNWLSQADVSGLYPTFITPAWYTFSIWWMIYLSWIFLWLYLLYKKHNEILTKEYLYLASAMLLSAVWLIPWHYQIICITFSIIFLILWILYYLIIYPPKNLVFRKISELYFWWILIATILNLHVFLVFSNKYEYWLELSIISILFGIYANYYLLKKYDTYISSLVFIWALLGIIIGQTNDYITITSIIWIFIITSKVIYKITKYNREIKENRFKKFWKK